LHFLLAIYGIWAFFLFRPSAVNPLVQFIHNAMDGLIFRSHFWLCAHFYAWRVMDWIWVYAFTPWIYGILGIRLVAYLDSDLTFLGSIWVYTVPVTLLFIFFRCYLAFLWAHSMVWIRFRIIGVFFNITAPGFVLSWFWGITILTRGMAGSGGRPGVVQGLGW